VGSLHRLRPDITGVIRVIWFSWVIIRLITGVIRVIWFSWVIIRLITGVIRVIDSVAELAGTQRIRCT
jgi:hypothetical protein